jgi:hypothetical protein
MTICPVAQTSGFIDFQVSENTADKPWNWINVGAGLPAIASPEYA